MAQYGFFPAPGADYASGVEPTIAQRLDRLGHALHLHLVGISGARSPSHSVAVGGSANDPHTRGQASDTPGVESVPESTLRRYGLTRPFAGAQEANHIQLLSTAGGTSSPTRQQPRTTLADLWVQAGGSRRLAPVMAAIAMAESGGQVDAEHKNDDGSTDYGVWQINSTHSQFDPSKLTSDPAYNARAAVAVERSQGLTAWTTYSSGAYTKYMGSGASNVINFPARTRPGGDPSGSGADFSTIFASYSDQGQSEDVSLWNSITKGFKWFIKPPQLNDPSLPHHVKIDPFGVGSAITSTGDFLKWIAWLFHPVNILRAVEFVTGITLLVIGIQSAAAVWRDAPSQASAEKIGKAAKRGAKETVSLTPVGRAGRVAKGVRQGKSEARAAETQRAARKARNKESARLKGDSEPRRNSGGRRRRGSHRTRLAEDIKF